MSNKVPQYPGYDVLRKRETPSWDRVTREVIDARLAASNAPVFLDAVRWTCLQALCQCILPQRTDQPSIPLAAMLDQRLQSNSGDGFRVAALPPFRQAWMTGLTAIDTHARALHALPFASLELAAQNQLLKGIQEGQIHGAAWQGMDPVKFFSQRVLSDLTAAYYSHPFTWSQIGFGGPANPRGYVRMYVGRRDPWEAAEGRLGDERVIKENQRVR